MWPCFSQPEYRTCQRCVIIYFITQQHWKVHQNQSQHLNIICFSPSYYTLRYYYSIGKHKTARLVQSCVNWSVTINHSKIWALKMLNCFLTCSFSSQWSISSRRWLIFSGSSMTKLDSKSNSPPTSCSTKHTEKYYYYFIINLFWLWSQGLPEKPRSQWREDKEGSFSLRCERIIPGKTHAVRWGLKTQST